MCRIAFTAAPWSDAGTDGIASQSGPAGGATTSALASPQSHSGSLVAAAVTASAQPERRRADARESELGSLRQRIATKYSTAISGARNGNHGAGGVGTDSAGGSDGGGRADSETPSGKQREDVATTTALFGLSPRIQNMLMLASVRFQRHESHHPDELFHSTEKVLMDSIK